LALFTALIGVSLKSGCGVIRAGVKRADKVFNSQYFVDVVYLRANEDLIEFIT